MAALLTFLISVTALISTANESTKIFTKHFISALYLCSAKLCWSLKQHQVQK